MGIQEDMRTHKRSQDSGKRVSFPYVLVLIFLVMVAVISAAGYLYSLSYKTRVEVLRGKELLSISELKADEITSWFKDHKKVVKLFSQGPFFADNTILYLQGKADARLISDLKERLSAIRASHDLRRVAIYGSDGTPYIVVPDDIAGPECPHLKSRVHEALAEKKIVFEDLHFEPDGRTISMSFVAPLLEKRDGAVSAVGAVVFEVDPYESLFRITRHWPVPGDSGEALIVRKDGDNVVFLSELARHKNAPLELKIPVSEKTLPAAAAARGFAGIMHGNDYSGNAVVAAISPIHGTPWYMVAKVDRLEILRSAGRGEKAIFLVVALSLLFIFVVMIIYWYRERAKYFRRQLAEESRRLALEKHFDYLSKYANDVILLTDADRRVITVNDRALEVYGYSYDEFIGMHLEDLCATDDRQRFDSYIKKTMSESGVVYEITHLRKDRSTIPVEVSFRLITVDAHNFYQAIIRDISERKKLEAETQFRAMLLETQSETTLDGILIVDSDGMPVLFNSQFLAMWGIPDDMGIVKSGKVFFEHALAMLKDPESFKEKVAYLYQHINLKSFDELELRDGRTFERYSAPMIDHDGACFGRIWYFRDITERKKAVQAIRESERQYKLLADNVTDLIWTVDLTLRFTYLSPSIKRMLGYDPAELVGRGVDSLLTPSALKSAIEVFSKERAVEESSVGLKNPARTRTIELEHRRKDGSCLLCELTTSYLRDANGRAFGIIGVTRDMTERVKAAENLVASETRFREMFEHMSSAVAIYLPVDGGEDFVFTSCNKALLGIEHIALEHVLGRRVTELFPRIKEFGLLDVLKRVHRTGEAENLPARFYADHRVSGWRENFIYKLPSGELVTIYDDVTKRVNAEEDARRGYDIQSTVSSILKLSLQDISLEAFLEESISVILSVSWLSNESRGAIFLLDEDSDSLVLTASKGLPSSARRACERIKSGTCLCGRAAKTKEIVFADTVDGRHNISYEGMAPHGHYCVPILSSGKVLGVLNTYTQEGIQRDDRRERFLLMIADTLAGAIERKRAQEAVRSSEERFRVLFEFAPDAYFLNDQNGNFIDANLAAEELTGYDRKDLEGKDLSSLNLFTPDQLARLQALAWTDDASAQPGPVEIENFRQSGEPVFVEVMAHPIMLQGKRVMLSVARDITRRKKGEDDLRRMFEKLCQTQTELIQSEKMAALGRFSSGIAHEVKNPLGVILGGAEFLESKLGAADADVNVAVTKIKEAAARANTILTTILQYARPSSLKTEKIALNDLVGGVVSLFAIQPSLVKVEIIPELSDEDIEVEVDKNQIHQVIFNIIKNAVEATHSGGRVVIRTGLERLGATIDIIDKGGGMSKDVLSRVYEPFFTTKGALKGTGLGLFVSKTIIDNHRGQMIIESWPGKGTDVKIILPLAA